jgi:hypothetical protein
VRLHYFRSCLELLAGRVLATKTPDDKPMCLAFPVNIGCGLAGGDWGLYEAMIAAFATTVQDKAKVGVVEAQPWG